MVSRAFLNSISTSPALPSSRSSQFLIEHVSVESSQDRLPATISTTGMDWTGGVRRRFAAGRNKSVLQKQKAHFAKARAALQKTPESHRSLRPKFLRSGTRPREESGARHLRIHPALSGPQQREITSTRHTKHEMSTAMRATRQHNGRNRELSRPLLEVGRAPRIVTVSSRRSTSAVSSTSSRRGSQAGSEGRQSHAITFKEEDRLLLANRRRLLARSDWLGLAPMKPVQIDFRSTSDKDHVGKRRKIDKSASHGGVKAEHHSVAPLFDDAAYIRDQADKTLMRPDDIVVRIGTDAWKSQTYRSRDSHMPDRDSRPSTTDLASLSEEPMLLGTDWDVHESALWPPEDHSVPEPTSRVAASMVGHDGSQFPEPLLRSSDDSDVQHLQRVQNSAASRQNHPESAISSVANSSPITDRGNQLHNSPFSTEAEWSMFDTAETIIQKQNAEQATTPTPHRDYSENDDDDEYWKRILDIKPLAPSQHSQLALKSSSLHLTASDESTFQPAFPLMADVEPIPSAGQLGLDATESKQRLPCELGTPASGFDSESPASNVQSPSSALERIDRNTHNPAIQDPRPAAEAEDEALWRQFIIGSPSFSDNPFSTRDSVWAPDGVDDPVTASAPEGSSLDVSGLGSSDKATMGDTLRSGSALGRESGAMTTDLSSRSIQAQATSPAHDADIPPQEYGIDDTDSIEEALSPVLPTRQVGNIHVSSLKVLNPKRFKPPPRSRTKMARTPSRFLAPMHDKAKLANQEHSVYDLLGSDGTSVA